MRKYQNLAVVGSVLEILVITITLFPSEVMVYHHDMLGNTSHFEKESAANIQSDWQFISTLLGYLIIPYIIAIVLAIAMKEHKRIVGAGLIIIGLYTLVSIFLFQLGHSLYQTGSMKFY